MTASIQLISFSFSRRFRIDFNGVADVVVVRFFAGSRLPRPRVTGVQSSQRSVVEVSTLSLTSHAWGGALVWLAQDEVIGWRGAGTVGFVLKRTVGVAGASMIRSATSFNVGALGVKFSTGVGTGAGTGTWLGTATGSGVGGNGVGFWIGI